MEDRKVPLNSILYLRSAILTLPYAYLKATPNCTDCCTAQESSLHFSHEYTNLTLPALKHKDSRLNGTAWKTVPGSGSYAPSASMGRLHVPHGLPDR